MIFRINKNSNYTVMSNYHFKERGMSLKAKGLLSLMLSLPDDWDYSIAGLATLSSDGETSVRSGLQELEKFGYLKRTKIRENGVIVDWQYDVFEEPLVGNQVVVNKDNKYTKESNTKKIVSKDTILINDAEPEFDFGYSDKKPKKQNLYKKCSDLIHSYIDDPEIVSLLHKYLDFVLEKYRNEGKVLYANQWKGLLNKLDDINDADLEASIKQSIQKGYIGFYPVNNHSNRPYCPDTNTAVQKKYKSEDDLQKHLARNDDGSLKTF